MPDLGGTEVAELVLASRNKHKVEELQRLLEGRNITVLTLSDFPGAPEVKEDGSTFAENARKKAKEIAAFTGKTVLADDSGLEVDALGGRPGVYSARFAGESASDAENNQKLLRLLAGVPAEKRTARFRCVIALATPDGIIETVEGSCQGWIGYEPRGSSGFGYDPLFVIDESGRTFAMLTREEKNRISHRGRALRRALPLIDKWRQMGRI